MTTTTDEAAILDQAYVQSQVIETGLERLTAAVSDVDPELSDRLSSCATSFDNCVQLLKVTRMLAASRQRTGEGAAV